MQRVLRWKVGIESMLNAGKPFGVVERKSTGGRVALKSHAITAAGKGRGDLMVGTRKTIGSFWPLIVPG